MVVSGSGGGGGGAGSGSGSGSSSSSSSGRVIQVTNIAPQATKDQMATLFGYLGRVDDIRLYPTVRDVSCPVASRICWVRYAEPAAAAVAPHLTNTVFIDRALIVVGVPGCAELPDEHRALQLSGAGLLPGLPPSQPEPRLPAHLVNTVDGMPPNQVIQTHDPRLAVAGLPQYPPLPAAYHARQIEEIRRTVLALDLHPDVTAQRLIDHFGTAGQVKYVRFCDRDSDKSKYALIEFTDQESVIEGLLLNGSRLDGHLIGVHHATQAITKPQTKSNEAAQREIEEAMCRVKEAQNLISAAIDPVIGLLSKDKRRTRSRSRSRRRSRSRQRSRRSRSRSRQRSRRSRSRSRHRSRRSRSRSRRRRHRSRSRSGHRHSHSRRSRSRGKNSRSKRDSSRTRDRDRDKEKEKKKEERKEEKTDSVEKEPSMEKKRSTSEEPSKEKHRSRSREKKSRERKRSRSRDRDRKRSRSREKRERRSRSRGKKRSRSRERKRSRSRERKRSRSRDRKRSRSRDRKRSRSRERKRSKSGDRKRSHSDSGSKPRTKSPNMDTKNRESDERDDVPKVARDYDEEERGFEADGASGKSEEFNATPDARSKGSPDNMDISNSP